MEWQKTDGWGEKRRGSLNQSSFSIVHVHSIVLAPKIKFGFFLVSSKVAKIVSFLALFFLMS